MQSNRERERELGVFYFCIATCIYILLQYYRKVKKILFNTRIKIKLNKKKNNFVYSRNKKELCYRSKNKNIYQTSLFSEVKSITNLQAAINE